MKEEHKIIAGPCACESEEQIRQTIVEAKARGVDTIRASLWKPRTRPGSFEGMGLEGLRLLGMIADEGLIPATEVMRSSDAERVVDEIVGRRSGEVLLWTGARTGVGQLIGDIAGVIKGEAKAKIMVKNPTERDEAHWMGMVEYAVLGCQDVNRVMICHRGFSSGESLVRNFPDMGMAMRVREDLRRRFGVIMPMLVDPSHICGRSDLVGWMMEKVIDDSVGDRNGGVNGFLVEVHPNPNAAKSDSKQQLSWEQYDSIVARIPIIRGSLVNLAVNI